MKRRTFLASLLALFGVKKDTRECTRDVDRHVALMRKLFRSSSKPLPEFAAKNFHAIAKAPWNRLDRS